MMKYLLATTVAISAATTAAHAKGRDSFQCMNFDTPKIERFYDKSTNSVDVKAFIKAQYDWLEKIGPQVDAMEVVMEYLASDEYGRMKMSIDEAEAFGCGKGAIEAQKQNGL